MTKLSTVIYTMADPGTRGMAVYTEFIGMYTIDP
jgi:hypothetical protein